MIHRYDPLMSRPIRLYWAGWETDTYRLAKEGWSLSAEQDVHRYTMRIAARHEQSGYYGLTEVEQFKYVRDPGYLEHVHQPTRMRLAKDIIFQGHMFPDFRAIDATPQLRPAEIKRLEDLAHFAPVPRRQLILPEASVPDLMERILELQQPAREHQLREDVLRGAKVHAQIISLAA